MLFLLTLLATVVELLLLAYRRLLATSRSRARDASAPTVAKAIEIVRDKRPGQQHLTQLHTPWHGVHQRAKRASLLIKHAVSRKFAPNSDDDVLPRDSGSTFEMHHNPMPGYAAEAREA